MLKAELYRIFSRKTVLAGMLIPILFVIFLDGGISVWEEGVVDEGRVYQGGEAITRDQEIAEEFAGTLTEETVREIWNRYGPSMIYQNRDTSRENLETLAKIGKNDNFCNRFVTRLFCREERGEQGEITYVLQEDLSENKMLQGEYIFGYTGEGWNWYWDKFFVAFVLVCIVIIVSLSPTFSEDYVCHTADVLLPAAKGRMGLWLTRILAGTIYSSLYYWLIMGILLIQRLIFYGAGGLAVSSGLTGSFVVWGEEAVPLWKTLTLMHFCGWLSVIFLTWMVLGLSARARQTFSTLMWSLLLYLGPFAAVRIILDQLPMVFVNRLVHYIVYSMPLTYAGMVLESPLSGRRFLTGLALAAALLAAGWGARGWCRHQVDR